MTIPIVATIAAGKVCQDADVKGIVAATVELKNAAYLKMSNALTELSFITWPTHAPRYHKCLLQSQFSSVSKGLTSPSTHQPGTVFTGQMTQPAMSKH